MIFKLDSSIFKPLKYYTNQISYDNSTCLNVPPSFINIPLGKPSRIIVIGDLHGDFYTLLEALYKAKVIDSFGN